MAEPNKDDHNYESGEQDLDDLFPLVEEDDDDEDSNNTHNISRHSRGTTGSICGGDKKEAFVERETRYVLLLRIIVVIILVCAGIAISVVVLKMTQSGEKENFESQYQATGRKIIGNYNHKGNSVTCCIKVFSLDFRCSLTLLSNQ